MNKPLTFKRFNSSFLNCLIDFGTKRPPSSAKPLRKTSLNFTIIDAKKIILTKGNLINKTLYEEKNELIVEEDLERPIYIENVVDENKNLIEVNERVKLGRRNGKIAYNIGLRKKIGANFDF